MLFSLLSVLHDPIPWHRYTKPEGALILFVQYVCVCGCAACIYVLMLVCMHVLSRLEWAIRRISWIRRARLLVGIKVLWSLRITIRHLLFHPPLQGEREAKDGGGGVKAEGRNMIYPSRYLMNLLWVAKLFMSLIAKFLHASLPFLASEPKSNSAWWNTHIHVHTRTHTHS